MKYIYTNQEGIQEEVAEERWRWAIEYKDGSLLEQFGKDGVFHRIGEIDQANARTWHLKHKDDPARVISIIVPDGAKLIHGYKVYGKVEGENSAEVKLYKFGIKVGSQHFLNYVLPDERIVQATEELNGIVSFEE